MLIKITDGRMTYADFSCNITGILLIGLIRELRILERIKPCLPPLTLAPATFTRLQAHAVPLVDNIESVINRLLDAYETKGGAPLPASEDGEASNLRQFNPNTPPDLTHTKVLAIEFGGKALPHGEVNWNGLLNAAVRLAKAKAKTTADLKKLVTVNFVAGQKTDEGYRFLSDVGLSVQGQDANGAWKGACHVAQQLGCKLNTTFIWRDKDGAAFPGITGQFNIGGRS